MRIAVLTTDTVHHRYFLQSLQDALGDDDCIVLNVFEQREYPWRARAQKHFRDALPNIWLAIGANPYIQWSYIDKRQTLLEKDKFFAGSVPELSDAFPTLKVDSINSHQVLKAFDEYLPDIGIVYGTAKVSEKIFSWPKLGLINAHGGILPEYRGLDTNLWAIYEGQPQNVGVTIHQIDRDLDTGDILKSGRIPLGRNLNIFNLRYHTTLICTELLLAVLNDLKKGQLTSRPQVSPGRYYGPMPVVIKLITNWRLRRYGS